jgi:hypothetical protein
MEVCRARSLMIGAVTGCVLFGGCVFDGLGPPDEGPTITGVIRSVEPESTPVRILIEENPDDADVGDAIYLRISGTSIWVQQADRSWRAGEMDDLQVGRTARAWAHVSGIDIYPARGTAKDIAILYPARR